jgi:signal transduction histidine kinase/ActR/RegA family two-component response regulator
MSCSITKRIVVIDDGADILDPLRRVLGCAEPSDEAAAPLLEGINADWVPDAERGPEAVRQALREHRPYLLAVLGVPAWSDAVETVHRLWEVDPVLEVLLYTAGDGSWHDRLARQLNKPRQCFFMDHPLKAACAGRLIELLVEGRLARDERGRCKSTLDSTRRALDRAREEVAEATRAKNEFMANISHEIRTPMNAIMGFSGLLLKEPLTADQKEKVTYVHDAGNALLRLINHMLDFSNLSTGRLKLNRAAFHLDDVLREVLDEVAPAARGKNLAVGCRIEQAVPRRLLGDKSRIRQVLFNLVDNAVKFTRHGSVHVRIALDEETDRAATLRIVITDTGVGIPADRQKVVFDGYAQADGSSTRRFEGAGVGLAICKQLVCLMGGQIGLRSTPGTGSSFWFTVTLKKQPAGGNDRHENARHETGPMEHTVAAVSSPRRPHVLVAEDDPLSRTLLEMLLGRAGCVVDFAGNGREATAAVEKNAVEKNSYDIVFMDIQMPEMDGLEAIRRIRRHEAETDRHVPIVALTANALPGDREQCLQAGADAYLAKPFNPDELLATLQRYLPGGLNANEPRPAVEAPDSAASDGGEESAKAACSPADCMSALCGALEACDFDGLEGQANKLKDLAARSGSTTVADHAMRVQLAARCEDPTRAAAAVERLRLALRDQPMQPLAHESCYKNPRDATRGLGD